MAPTCGWGISLKSSGISLRDGLLGRWCRFASSLSTHPSTGPVRRRPGSVVAFRVVPLRNLNRGLNGKTDLHTTQCDGSGGARRACSDKDTRITIVKTDLVTECSNTLCAPGDHNSRVHAAWRRKPRPINPMAPNLRSKETLHLRHFTSISSLQTAGLDTIAGSALLDTTRG